MPELALACGSVWRRPRPGAQPLAPAAMRTHTSPYRNRGKPTRFRTDVLRATGPPPPWSGLLVLRELVPGPWSFGGPKTLHPLPNVEGPRTLDEPSAVLAADADKFSACADDLDRPDYPAFPDKLDLRLAPRLPRPRSADRHRFPRDAHTRCGDHDASGCTASFVHVPSWGISVNRFGAWDVRVAPGAQIRVFPTLPDGPQLLYTGRRRCQHAVPSGLRPRLARSTSPSSNRALLNSLDMRDGERCMISLISLSRKSSR